MIDNNFEVRRKSGRPFDSVIFASAALRGLAVSISAVNATDGQITAVAAQASNKNFLGHLVRDITVAGGPTVEDQVFNKGLESAGKAGRENSVEVVEEYEAEGSDYIEQTTNPLLVNSALGTPVTFKDGKAKIAVAGDQAFYTLAGLLTARDSTSTPAKRFVFRRCVPFEIPTP
jgi:hypothetical protein